jgi:hypothetical protein
MRQQLGRLRERLSGPDCTIAKAFFSPAAAEELDEAE